MIVILLRYAQKLILICVHQKISMSTKISTMSTTVYRLQ